MKLSRTLALAALSTGLGLGLPTPWQSFPGGMSVEAAATGGPLDPLTVGEISTVFKTIEAYSKFPAGAVFPIVKLREPDKSDVLERQSTARQAFAEVYDARTNTLYEAVVDLNERQVVEWTPKPGNQPGQTNTDYVRADAIARADPRWQAAIKARGLNPDDVYLDGWSPAEPLPPGVIPGHRFIREVSFFRPGQVSGQLSPNPYDRPIEGPLVTVDLNEGKVVHFIDTGQRPVNTTTSGNATSTRTDLMPLIVTQPNGPSFHIDGNAVTWQRWHFRVGYSPREGMVLHQIGYEDKGVVRPVIYRLSLSEIFVPYGIPDPNWVWRAALDVGEYNLGQYAEPLQKGVDVPSNAVFFDEATASDTGSAGGPIPVPHGIAMYERDAGSLWDRADPTTLVRDARFARELVLTTMMPIGNYTYGFDYIFRMDGGMDIQVRATGTTLNQGVSTTADGEKFGTTVAPRIAAPTHQHFFNFRIDFDVDGTNNRLVEKTTHAVATPSGNAFVTDSTLVGNEGARDSAPNRWWEVQSTTRNNAVGLPTAYALRPGSDTAPLADANKLSHAEFAAHALWVTRQRDGELYAAGDYPKEGPPGRGLPEYTARHENVNGKDLVVWYTMGFAHVPTVEDYPVMTTDLNSFSIRPSGFFDQNPALDAP